MTDRELDELVDEAHRHSTTANVSRLANHARALRQALREASNDLAHAVAAGKAEGLLDEEEAAESWALVEAACSLVGDDPPLGLIESPCATDEEE